jgi:ComEC/Rec2-related protein
MKLPAFWSAVLFVSGIWIGRSMQIPDMLLFLMASIFFIAGMVVYLKSYLHLSWIIVAGALLMAGFFRIGLEVSGTAANDVGQFNDLGERVGIKGEIIREPDIRSDKTLLTVRVDTIIIDDKKISVSGRVLVRLKYMSSGFSYADYVRAHGFLSTPIPARNPGAFDYREYLANKKIGSIFYVSRPDDIGILERQSGNPFLTKIVIPLRRYILSIFERYIDSPQRSLIAGFLIGEVRFIPSEIHQNFRDTGTLHLLAVSGSNVALVIGTVELILLLAWVPSRQRHIIALFVIILFSYLSYNQPSVVRASVMISLYLLGRLAYRKVNYINILSMAAILILIFEPLMLWDVGFQLSFAATFGLVYFLPLIYRRLSTSGSVRKKIPSFILMTFFSSAVAQLAVAPILAANFNTIPIIGLFANLLIVPLASIAVILSLFLVFLGWFGPLGSLLGFISDQVLEFTINCVNFFADFPLAKIAISSPEWYMIALYYLALILAFRLLKDMKNLKYLIIVVFVFVNIAVWQANLEAYRINPRITALDMRGNPTVHLRCCDGGDYLIREIPEEDSGSYSLKTLKSYSINVGVHDPLELSTSNQFQIETSIPPDHVSAKRDRISLLKLSEKDSIFGALYKHEDHAALILLSNNRLLACEDIFQSPQVLMLPEPGYITDEFIDFISALSPKILIFSGYKLLYREPPGYDLLKRALSDKNIDFYNVRECGAVRIMFEESKISIKPMLECD